MGTHPSKSSQFGLVIVIWKKRFSLYLPLYQVNFIYDWVLYNVGYKQPLYTYIRPPFQSSLNEKMFYLILLKFPKANHQARGQAWKISDWTLCFSKQKLAWVIAELTVILELTLIPIQGRQRHMELCCSPAPSLCSSSIWLQSKSPLWDHCSCSPPSRWARNGQQEQENRAVLFCPLTSAEKLVKTGKK